MSAPAALAAAKLSFPSHDEEEILVPNDADGKHSVEKARFLRLGDRMS